MQKPTSQEIFDTVVEHLWGQGYAAMHTNEFERRHLPCAYRASDGRRCAVGCLFTDDEYHYDMEGKTVDELARLAMLPRRLSDHVPLLTDLQYVHDHYARARDGDSDDAFHLHEEFDPRRLDESLNKVASTHGLNYARRHVAEETAS